MEAKSPPPRWFVKTAWVVHRAIYALTGGRFGLRPVGADRYGMLRLHTVGRHSGQERTVILAYLEDGADLILIAMNGWSAPAPAWWLNLQARPDATVDLPNGSRDVRARLADPPERPRLWQMWVDLGGDIDAFAAGVPNETPVVILEPRGAPA